VVGGGRPLVPKSLGQTVPVREQRNFQSAFARSASAVTPSEKVQLTLIRTYGISNALKPLKGGLKMQNDLFPFKIALHLKKVCYKVSSCKHCQRQCCKAFTGLSICAKIVRGDVPYYVKFSETDPPPSKTPISKQYSLVAPQP